jgi:hypothetical protein
MYCSCIKFLLTTFKEGAGNGFLPQADTSHVINTLFTARQNVAGETENTTICMLSFKYSTYETKKRM